MNKEKVLTTISNYVRKKEIMRNITEGEDFFDIGVSSLTVVELQISIESELGLQVPTSLLIASPTINGWVDIYMNEANAVSVEQ